jgi:hypothetical protein
MFFLNGGKSFLCTFLMSWRAKHESESFVFAGYFECHFTCHVIVDVLVSEEPTTLVQVLLDRLAYHLIDCIMSLVSMPSSCRYALHWYVILLSV